MDGLQNHINEKLVENQRKWSAAERASLVVKFQ
jgi:hypothetical protein